MRIVTAPGAPAPRGLWRYRLDRRRALIGGATSEGGNVWAWCRETLRLPDDDGAIEGALAAYAPGGLVALPFLAGERAPGWRGNKRAALARLSLDTTALDITAAMLDAVALRLALIYELLAPCAAADAPIIASGGGIARSRAWTQMIADAIGRPVIRSDITEATSRGAALLALEVLGAGELSGRTVPSGETLVPDAARHARAREALAQQRALDDRL
jgi:gluconokinase